MKSPPGSCDIDGHFREMEPAVSAFARGCGLGEFFKMVIGAAASRSCRRQRERTAEIDGRRSRQGFP